jgi:Right handed beta helix region
MTFDLQTIIIAAVSAGIGMFAKPVAERLVDRFFNRKPVFAISPHVLRDDWLVQIHPVNSPARHKRPLNLSFRGAITIGAGSLKEKGGTLQWQVDLSNLESVRDELLTNTFADFQLFFDPNHMSEMMRITYKQTLASQTTEPHSSISVNTIKSFIQGVSSRRTIFVRDTELLMSDGFPTSTGNVSWNSVFDGKEISISNLEDFEILGENAALLAQPQYAWVLSFVNCRNVTLSDLTIGHLTSGYCQGGVIKFENCSGVKIRNCDLYGSGTYGFEFVGCSDVDIDTTTIRDCSYGILKISNCNSITFTDCNFASNREFDLCVFTGSIEQIMFRKCVFERNFSRDVFFHLRGVTQMGSGLYVWDCSFIDNDCQKLEDETAFFSESGNKFSGNGWQQRKT